PSSQYKGSGLLHDASVHGTHHGILGEIEVGAAPVVRRVYWVIGSKGITIGVFFIANDLPVGAKWTALEPHMPIHIIAAEESQRYTLVSGDNRMLPHSCGPVFGVLHDDE